VVLSIAESLVFDSQAVSEKQITIKRKDESFNILLEFKVIKADFYFKIHKE
jgi:hypothetical protein